MDVPEDLTLVCLVRINATKLPENVSLRDLPGDLSSAVLAIVQKAYLDDKYYAVKNYTTVRSAVNALAEPFDEIAGVADNELPEGVIPLHGRGRGQYLN